MSEEDETEDFDREYSRYLAMEEQRHTGNGLLMPEPGDELDSRVSQITRVSGRKADKALTIAASYEMELGEAMIEHRKPDDSRMLKDPLTKSYLLLSLSDDGWRARQIVEMNRATHPPEQRRTLFNLFNRKKAGD